MPRCAACDKNLNDFETTRKIIRDDGTVYYPDLCNECYHASGLADVANVVERLDLATEEDTTDETFFEDDINDFTFGGPSSVS